MEILELNKISKNFGAIKALDNVTLSLRSGEVLGLMGDNGAGKSTLINNLINEDRLIVSEIAGTTIDAISVPFEYNNEKFILIDTAGIRKGYKYNHKVEYFSYVRAMHAIDESDIVIFICDINDGIVVQDLKIIKPTMSLAGVESTITSPALSSHKKMDPEIRRSLGISDSLLRFSVGIENFEDLVLDLDKSLTKNG